MKISIDNTDLELEMTEIGISDRNQENIFKGNNKRTLHYRIDKALHNPKDCLHKIAKEQKEKYSSFLNMKLGNFLIMLKDQCNQDYQLYLNKYGDEKFCHFSLNNFSKDKGLYCFIVDERIVYVGRTKINYKSRIKEYGKITPYKCLKDGQATNCNVNSRVNKLDCLFIGFHLMNNSTDNEIEELEKKVISNLSVTRELWNIQRG